LLLAHGELRLGCRLWLCDEETALKQSKKRKKKEKFKQCDNKNSSRASVQQDNGSNRKRSNTAHNYATGLLDSEYRVVNSLLTSLVF